MFVDRFSIEEYPYKGKFVRLMIDDSKPLDQQIEEEVTILEVDCDIQESNKTDGSGLIKASFEVYFPFDTKQNLTIKRGDYFIGEMYGMQVNGTIFGIFPTQLGGVCVTLTDRDI